MFNLLSVIKNNAQSRTAAADIEYGKMQYVIVLLSQQLWLKQ